jgi:antitoxin ParD1/3/4
MATTTLNISLPEALKEHVQKRVAEGACSGASDFVRALIRLDKEQQEKLAALRLDIAVGTDQFDRGEGLDGERVFAELFGRRPAALGHAPPRPRARGAAGPSRDPWTHRQG